MNSIVIYSYESLLELCLVYVDKFSRTSKLTQSPPDRLSMNHFDSLFEVYEDGVEVENFVRLLFPGFVALQTCQLPSSDSGSIASSIIYGLYVICSSFIFVFEAS